MQYSILIPVYNNANTIPLLYKRLVNTVRLIESNFEFIFINDASLDNSLSLLLELQKHDNRIKIIDAEKNYGQALAFYIGVKYAVGNYSIFISADLQEDETIIQKFILKTIEQQNADLIIGVRESNNDFFLFKLFSSFFYFVLHLRFPNIPRKGFDTACVNKELASRFLNTYYINDFIQTRLIDLSKHTESILYHRQASQDRSLKRQSILFKIRYFIQGFKQLLFAKNINKNKTLAKDFDFKLRHIYTKSNL